MTMISDETFFMAKRGDEKAIGEIFDRFEPLIHSQALSMKNYANISIDDLLQEARIGLVEAVNSYDVTKTSFGTYAKRVIRSKLLDFCYQNTSIVSLSNNANNRKAFFNYRKLKSLNHSDSEIAEILGIPKATVDDVSTFFSPNLSLSPSSDDSDDGFETMEFIAKLYTDDMEDDCIGEIDAGKLSTKLMSAMESLSQTQREVINRRYLTEEPETLKDIGGVIGCSKQWVKTIEVRSLESLREHLTRSNKSV